MRRLNSVIGKQRQWQASVGPYVYILRFASVFNHFWTSSVSSLHFHLVGLEQDRPPASPSPLPLVCLPESPLFYDALIYGAPRRVALELDNVYKDRVLAAVSQDCKPLSHFGDAHR